MQHEEHEKENSERWLLTYSDLITLLLAFFIILFAISNIDKEKYLQVIQSLGEVFGDQAPSDQSSGTNNDLVYPVFTPHTSELPSNVEGTPNPDESTAETAAMENVKAQLESLLEQEHLADDISVSLRSQGLVITINTKILFAKGSADLNPSAVELVQKLSGILTPLKDNEICVEGHTDSDPIHTSQFYSNWELSSARANTVLEDDGSFRLVLAHRDPKVPNWLDTEGRTSGSIFWRFFLPEGPIETPRAQIVPFTQLPQHLRDARA